MPETFEFTTQIDGKDVKITLPSQAVYDSVKETHLPKDSVSKDLDKRAQRIVENGGYRKVDEMLADQAVIDQILEKHGKKGTEGDGAAAQQLRDALARQKADIEARDIAPLKKSIETQTAREQALLVKDLERQIMAATAPYVRESMIKAPGKGKQPPIVTMLRDAFAFDKESGEFYVADGENFVISGSGNSTYKTVDEYAAEWLALPANADFLKPGQGGPGVTGRTQGGGRAAGDVVLSPEQASNRAEYAKALEKVGGDHSRIKVTRPQQNYF